MKYYKGLAIVLILLILMSNQMLSKNIGTISNNIYSSGNKNINIKSNPNSLNSILKNYQVSYIFHSFNAILYTKDSQEIILYNNKIFNVTNSHFSLDISTTNPKLANPLAVSDIVNIQNVWNNGYNGTGVVVAVVDSGISTSHPALTNKVIMAKSFVTKANGYPNDEGTSDIIGHGTGVASLIAGYDISSSFKGMGFGSLLVNAKVAGGTLSASYITTVGILKALDWIASLGIVNVVNLSLSEPEEGPGLDVLEMAINDLVSNYGIIVTTSAGNNGATSPPNDPFTIGSPSSAPESLSIGAIDNSLHSTFFTSQGPTYGWQAKPDLVAPGYSVTAATNTGGYSAESGTSFSSPIVAGVVATLLSFLIQNNINYNPGMLKAALTSTATDLGYNWEIQGNGLLNATAAYLLLSQSTKLIDIYPRSFPYQFWKNIPRGESINQPISIASYKNHDNFVINNIANNTQNISFKLSELYSGYTDIYDLNITIPTDANLGIYTFNMTLSNSDNISKWFIVSIQVMPKAEKRLLIDLIHTQWDSIVEPSNFGTGPVGPLERVVGTDMMKIVSLMRSNNIWVNEISSGPLTFNILKNYDIIWIPSAFSLLQPSFYDHSFQGTILSSSELFALKQFKDSGGSFIIDFAGTSRFDNFFSSDQTDSESLFSLLSLFEFQISSLTRDTSVSTSSILNQTSDFSSSYQITTGINSFKNGISLTTLNGENLAAISYTSEGGKVLLINNRNWRDSNSASVPSEVDFMNNTIQWLDGNSFLKSINYINNNGKLELQLETMDSSSQLNNFQISIINNSGSLSLVNKNKVGNIFSFIFNSLPNGSSKISINYGSSFEIINHYFDWSKPSINSVSKNFTINQTKFLNLVNQNSLYSMNFTTVDNSNIYKYNVILDSTNKAFLNSSSLIYNDISHQITIELNTTVLYNLSSSNLDQKIQFSIGVIDEYSNYARYNFSIEIGNFTESNTKVSPTSNIFTFFENPLNIVIIGILSVIIILAAPSGYKRWKLRIKR